MPNLARLGKFSLFVAARGRSCLKRSPRPRVTGQNRAGAPFAKETRFFSNSQRAKKKMLPFPGRDPSAATPTENFKRKNGGGGLRGGGCGSCTHLIFSTLYLAFVDEDEDCPVAVKVFNTDRNGRVLFENECAVLADLPAHPALLEFHGSGCLAKQQPFIAMEYFPHPTLQSYLKTHGPLPEEVALEIIKQLVRNPIPLLPTTLLLSGRTKLRWMVNIRD